MRDRPGWNRMRGSGVVLSAIGLAVGLAGPVLPDSPDTRVTLQLRDTPLRQALESLFRDSGRSYAVDSGVRDVRITASALGVTREAALRLIVNTGAAQEPGLSYRREADVYVIGIRPPAPAPVIRPRAMPGTDRIVSFSFDAFPVREALRKLCVGSGIRCRVHPDISSVPISLSRTGIPLPEALGLVVKQASDWIPGLVLLEEAGGYRVEIDDEQILKPGSSGLIRLPGEGNLALGKIRLRNQNVAEIVPLLLYLMRQQRVSEVRPGTYQGTVPPRTGGPE